MNNSKLPVWELLQKKITWNQLHFIKNKKILDFGSGHGLTAEHFAQNNEVIAIEPNDNMLANKFNDKNYTEIKGNINYLKNFENESFDVILCHNVFEYALEREDILKEFSRLLKKDGLLSILKHNRPGRIMQMVVLLNNFEEANNLLDGQDGRTKLFGPIHYYNDNDLLRWCSDFKIAKTLGIRSFWDLQQNQDIQKDEAWQKKMIAIEERVSDDDRFKSTAFFHHILLTKREV